MDLGAHNATLELLSYRRRLSRFRYFIFLNSSVKGPFAPPWTPPGWHWTHAYLARFEGDVHAVGSSLVCLPPADAGGPGPRLESWAFALDGAGLAAALEAGVFVTRGCKLCADGGDGIVVGGEYGLTKAQLAAGHNVAALMARYARGTDWRDERHWGCNDNAHPSRQGTYAGISQHPFETVRALCGAVCVVAVLWLDVFPVCCRPVLACCCSVCASQSLPLSPPHATPRRTTHLTHMPQHTHTHHPNHQIFVKASWHVADVYTRRYSHWALQHLLGRAGTDGAYDARLYRYAVSEAAQAPRDLEAAYRPDAA